MISHTKSIWIAHIRTYTNKTAVLETNALMCLCEAKEMCLDLLWKKKLNLKIYSDF